MFSFFSISISITAKTFMFRREKPCVPYEDRES